MGIPIALAFFALISGLALIASVFTGRLTLPAALDIAMLLAALGWLFLLVKIPWDLYFAARKGRIDGDESKRRGIENVEGQTRQLARLEKRLVWAALAAHALTAAAIYAIGIFGDGVIRPGFAWLFLGSAALRPAWEAYGYLRARLADLAHQTRYPREDVQLLANRITAQEEAHKALLAEHKAQREELEARLRQMDLTLQQVQKAHIETSARHEKRLVQLSQRFEDAVSQMTSDQELLTGIRAFARLFREESSSADGP